MSTPLTTDPSAAIPAPSPEALEREIAVMIVEALNLEVAPQEIDPEARLYQEGLGLDSIDILEVALVVSKRYGFKLRDDDQDNVRIFSSLRNLARTVSERRTK
ncbi:MAG: acyl carrier protein [Betaproteobacteria bacterium]|nr:acyl carrier protein [Betaproteobacteria bacterium]